MSNILVCNDKKGEGQMALSRSKGGSTVEQSFPTTWIQTVPKEETNKQVEGRAKKKTNKKLCSMSMLMLKIWWMVKGWIEREV